MSASPLTVGVVMRTRNRPLLLRRAMASVRAQTYPHWRLVIVNDGGDAEPVEALRREIFGDDPRVELLRHAPSRGMEAASNAGLARLATDLAAIHDDDDSWDPDMLAAATRAYAERRAQFPGLRGVVAQVVRVDEAIVGDAVRIDRRRAWSAGPQDALEEGFVDLARLLAGNLFPPIAFLFDLAAARALGGFDETLPVLGDWDFHLRFVAAHDVWVHPQPLAFYHHRPAAQGDLGNTIYAGRDAHRIYDRYVRNRWLRSAMGGAGPGSVAAALLREALAPRETRAKPSRLRRWLMRLRRL